MKFYFSRGKVYFPIRFVFVIVLNDIVEADGQTNSLAYLEIISEFLLKSSKIS